MLLTIVTSAYYRVVVSDISQCAKIQTEKMRMSQVEFTLSWDGVVVRVCATDTN